MLGVLQLQRGLENFRLGNPYQHASFHLSHLTVKDMFSPEEQLESLHSKQMSDHERSKLRLFLGVTVEDLQAWIPKIFVRSHIEGLVHGNIVKEDALALLENTKKTVNAEPLSLEERLSARCLIPPPGQLSAILDRSVLNHGLLQALSFFAERFKIQPN